MYQMDQLLELLTIEKARELRFRGGRPPLMVLEDEQHSLQGPSITDEEVMQLLRNLANSRQMRDLREQGKVAFVHTAVGRAPYVVRAQIENENVVFSVS
jgi:Tfp pilus assembly ATPase PilU